MSLSVSKDSSRGVIARLAAAVGQVVHDAGCLGRDHQLVAGQLQFPERVADQGFGLSQRVDVGGIDEIDALIEGKADEFTDRALIQAAHDLPESVAAEGHPAQTHLGDVKSRFTKKPVFHRVPPLLVGVRSGTHLRIHCGLVSEDTLYCLAMVG
jgi:hypothetical protein